MPKLTAQEQLAVEQRRKDVAEAYLRRETQLSVAERLGVNEKTVRRDLAVVRKEWLKASQDAFDQRKAEELARIDRIERKAEDAWERSCDTLPLLKQRSFLGQPLH